MPAHPIHRELDDPPTCEELRIALSKSRKGKAGGKTKILPKLLVCGGTEMHDSILKLVWEEGSVVADWKDAEIVPIPKKGNLKRCDNWRGISLLDVVGKVFMRVCRNECKP